MFEIVFDNVTILPANSCNRDIREMRANELVLKISEPKIEALVEEGYKVYDANGNLKQKMRILRSHRRRMQTNSKN